jgi:hypothetical protein
MHNAGVYIRDFFTKNYFKPVHESHTFQSLTESTKSSPALRKGIYLSTVTEDGADLKFNLLRCSSNLSGPTDSFRQCDNEIIDQVNAPANSFFTRPAELNHALVQIYENRPTDHKSSD